jgi:hypothetical protein
MRKYLRNIGLLFLVCVLPLEAVAQGVTPAAPVTASPSVVEIPIRLSLDGLFEEAEREMPLQAGNPYRWQSTFGVLTRYHAWRGPLLLAMQGNELVVQAHVRYWLQAHKKLPGGLTLKSSCGLDEAPRQALIGVRIRLDWSADWVLLPRFRVMEPRFLDGCEMTFADIDITPLVAREFQQQLALRMQRALRAQAPRLRGIRYRAEQTWAGLQQAIQLGDRHWLLLHPQGLALSPLFGQGRVVDTQLAVLMAPQLVAGDMPRQEPRPLPPLLQLYPNPTGLKLALAVDMRYADLSRSMTGELAGAEYEFGGHRAVIESVELGGSGQEVVAKVHLGGDLAGDVEIRANLAFDPESQQFHLVNLAYTATLEDIWMEADANLLYGQIRRTLEQNANRQLQQRMGEWRQRLLAVFERIMPEDMQADLDSLRFQDVQFSLSPGGIRLDGVASGRIDLAL